MSVQGTSDSQALEVELQLLVQRLTVNNIFLYGLTSVTVLLVYDLFLCLGQESHFIWKKKVTLTTVLYLFTRYAPLLFIPLFLIYSLFQEYYPKIRITSQALLFSIISDILGGFSLISIQGLLGIRLYAVYEGKKTILRVLLFLYVIGIGTEIASVAVNMPAMSNQIAPLYLRALALTHTIFVIIFDTMVFLGTIYKIYGTWKLQKEIGSEGRSITDIIIRQGILRYSVILILSIVTVILQHSIDLLITIVVSALEQALSSLIICRLTLELRERYETQIDEVALPTLSWSVESVRQGAQYVHNTIIAEAAGEFGSYGNDPTEES